MRWRTKLRYVSYRLARFWTRTTYARPLRLFVTMWCIGAILGAIVTLVSADLATQRLWEWAEAGWRFARGRLLFAVNAENGMVMMGSVLASLGPEAPGPEPFGDWERPLRAWIHTLTGYDLASPRSFLEAEVGGFRQAVLSSLDVVRLPPRQEDAGGPPTGQPTAVPGTNRRGPGDLESAGAPKPQDQRQEGDAILQDQALPPLRAGVDERFASHVPAPLRERLAALAAADWGPAPRVLILHSHTSESYRTIPPDPRADARHHVYNDADTGITRVGRALAERLQHVYGIGTIHSTRIHNWPHHWEAYVNARETVQEILARYPSIDIVLDVHRQGIENAVWSTAVGSVEAVSVEVIYTTSRDFQYATHPNWRRNEAFARVLARAMEEVHPGLLNRVTAVHNRRYNQDLHPHMLLLEVGNYLDLEEHAIAAATLLADAVAIALDEIRSGRIDQMLAPRSVPPPQPPRPVPSSGPPRR